MSQKVVDICLEMFTVCRLSILFPCVTANFRGKISNLCRTFSAEARKELATYKWSTYIKGLMVKMFVIVAFCVGELQLNINILQCSADPELAGENS